MAASDDAASAPPCVAYDIFALKVARHLDPHLALAVTSNFVRELKLYSERSCLQAEHPLQRE